MSDSRLQALLLMVVAAYTWEPPIADVDVMDRAGACVQLHIENF